MPMGASSSGRFLKARAKKPNHDVTRRRARGRGELSMRISTLVICAFVIGASLAMLGCGHK
ncbi:MAG: hypothetical protein WCA22_08035, partial [Candidatus Binatus sp.]